MNGKFGGEDRKSSLSVEQLIEKLTDSNLSRVQSGLLQLIIRHGEVRQKNGMRFSLLTSTTRTLAHQLNCSVSSVFDAIKRLESYGLITAHSNWQQTKLLASWTHIKEFVRRNDILSQHFETTELPDASFESKPADGSFASRGHEEKRCRIVVKWIPDDFHNAKIFLDGSEIIVRYEIAAWFATMILRYPAPAGPSLIVAEYPECDGIRPDMLAKKLTAKLAVLKPLIKSTKNGYRLIDSAWI